MRQTQGTRGIGVAAALIAAALHLLVIHWLLAQRVAPRVASAQALQVTWIGPAAPSIDDVAAEATASRPPARTRTRAVISIVATSPVPAPDPARADAADAPAAARGHDLMRQAQAWSQRQPLRAEFVPDPLRHREAAPDGRFAMRDPVSVADVARGIGQLFGGPGYTTDPCPRVRRNIGALGSGGNSELLDEELRRLRTLCP
ncbi:hypothetical protein E4582_12485 [Luteimonas yindakuii]|uniref:Uncharacterized protein n=1 Tax=Luteimonas yindakuii TaxID=2565782 RepID=A0A4Z1R263_9GAMM|nr:hypothetical protein [Luteimonas yindakuii]TKS53016.1 hypothetical protein E4582_12485 [Luteimonas yindakuii]